MDALGATSVAPNRALAAPARIGSSSKVIWRPHVPVAVPDQVACAAIVFFRRVSIQPPTMVAVRPPAGGVALLMSPLTMYRGLKPNVATPAMGSAPHLAQRDLSPLCRG